MVLTTPPEADPRPSRDPEAMAWRVATRGVLLVFAILIGGWLLIQLRSVVVQVLLAVIISAGMTPLVDRFSGADDARPGRWRPPRALVVLALYLALILLVVVVGMLVLPPLIGEAEDLAARTPSYVANLQAWIQELPARYAFLPADLDQTIASQLQAAALQVIGLLSQALVVVEVALGVLGGALNGIFVLILALYITADSRRILGYVLAFAPGERQPQAARVARRIGQRLGGWVRGQLLLSGIIGLMTLVGLSALGVRYAVLLAIIAAVGEAIPMIGPIISAVPAVAIAFTHSPLQGFLTIGLYLLIQQLENNLVVPRVMSRAVSLHPLAVMVALLAGSELMGVTGAILSVPVTAALSVIVDEMRRERLGRLGLAEDTDP
jgi:predicted PurR-regulated permease PerM